MYKKRCFVSVGLSPMKKRRKKTLIIDLKKRGKNAKAKRKDNKNKTKNLNFTFYTL